MPIALSDEPASAARPAAVAVNNEPVAVAEEHEVTLALPLDAADAVASDDHEAAASAEPIATHDVAIVSSGDDDRERDSMEERFDVVADSRPVGRPASDESIPVTVGTETMADEAGEQPVSFDDHTPEVFVEDIQLPGSEPAHASVPGHDVISEAASEAPFSSEVEEDEATPVRPPAIVVPLTRQGRSDAAGDVKGGVAATLQRLLRLAAARGAATVYVVAQSAPMVRVDGEFSVLDGEPTLNSAFVERLLAELAPHTREAGAPAAEWIADVPEIGRVRCVTFRDHRGPGIIFRMVPPRAISADQLGLSAEVQALCTDADGLVLVAGGRGSGRSTLLTSFVDLVNRTRSDHVITVEPHIEFVHENKRSFISQREVRGSAEAVGAAVRAAGREEPDVLVVEDLRTPELVAMALEAAESGRLVFVSVPAVSTISAVERFIEMFPAERREKAQASLAAALRGVVSQVLLRKLRGGRVAAREVLINTPEVAALIAEGKISQLMHALETGRKQGMMSFAESFSALVREGVVHPSHAYRKAPDREHFLTLLRRDGVDTTIAERLA
jgi:twitching motility protein PilT